MSQRSSAKPRSVQRQAALEHLEQVLVRMAELPALLPRAELPTWVGDDLVALQLLLRLPAGVARRSDDVRRLDEAGSRVSRLWSGFRRVPAPEVLAQLQGWQKNTAPRPDWPTDIAGGIEELKTVADLLRGDRPPERG